MNLLLDSNIDLTCGGLRPCLWGGLLLSAAPAGFPACSCCDFLHAWAAKKVTQPAATAAAPPRPCSPAGINEPVLLGDLRGHNTLLHLAASRGWGRLAEALLNAGGPDGPLGLSWDAVSRRGGSQTSSALLLSHVFQQASPPLLPAAKTHLHVINPLVACR